jgi:5-methylcytosine-specific restriction enzyme A
MPQPFIPGQLYKRTDIHQEFGGSGQNGISPSRSYPYIFIFSGAGGVQHGYRDGWLNKNVYSYTGEGQSGDMSFVRGNRALRDHMQNGKRVFLFEYRSKGYVEYICELEYHDFAYFESHDTGFDQRIAIKFYLKRKGSIIPYAIEDTDIAADKIRQPDTPNVTERQSLVLSRVGHGAYRKSLIYRWDNECAVTGYNNLKVLIASHIVPWSEANDFERVDINNGILLSPTYDALFDRHLITFDQKGKIILSHEVEKSAYHKIGVTGKEQIHKFNAENFRYLEKHNEIFLLR